MKLKRYRYELRKILLKAEELKNLLEKEGANSRAHELLLEIQSDLPKLHVENVNEEMSTKCSSSQEHFLVEVGHLLEMVESEATMLNSTARMFHISLKAFDRQLEQYDS